MTSQVLLPSDGTKISASSNIEEKLNVTDSIVGYIFIFTRRYVPDPLRTFARELFGRP